MPGWVVVSVMGLTLLLVTALGVALAHVCSRSSRATARTDAETLALRAQVDDIERRLAAQDALVAETAEPQEYVITRLGDEGDDGPAPGQTPAVGAPLFADLVLRESVVQAASMAAGLRRALAPETRHKIRFEMKREVKRARKQRRADLRAARREWAARQRAEVDPEDSAEDSAA